MSAAVKRSYATLARMFWLLTVQTAVVGMLEICETGRLEKSLEAYE